MRIGYLMSIAMSAAIAMPVTALAAGDHAHGRSGSGQQAAATAETIQGKGVVKALKDGKVTLSHEAIPALKWPPMTMDFTLQEPGLAQGLKVGDAVLFELRPAANGYVINAIQAAK